MYQHSLKESLDNLLREAEDNDLLSRLLEIPGMNRLLRDDILNGLEYHIETLKGNAEVLRALSVTEPALAALADVLQQASKSIDEALDSDFIT